MQQCKKQQGECKMNVNFSGNGAKKASSGFLAFVVIFFVLALAANLWLGNPSNYASMLSQPAIQLIALTALGSLVPQFTFLTVFAAVWAGWNAAEPVASAKKRWSAWRAGRNGVRQEKQPMAVPNKMTEMPEIATTAEPVAVK